MFFSKMIPLAASMVLAGSMMAGELKDFKVIESPTYPAFRADKTVYTSVMPQYLEKLTLQFAAGGDEPLYWNGKALDGNSLEIVPADGILTYQFSAGQGGTAYTFRVKRYPALPAWKKLTGNAGFPPRDSAGEFCFNNKLWIIGGYLPAVVCDIWCSEDGIHWEQKADLPNPGGVNIPVEYVFDNAMWIFGEGRPQSLFTSKDGENWTKVCEECPMGKRYAAGGTVFDGYMWYAGGQQQNTLLNDVWRSKDGKKWECVTEHAAWSPRQLFGGMLAHNGYLWILGGGRTSYHPFAASSDIWRSKDGKNWECVNEAAPWEGRIWYAGAVFKNRLWLIGGYQCEPESRNLGDVWYSYDGVSWYEFKGSPELRKRYDVANNPDPQPEVVLNPKWSARHETSVIVRENTLYVIAGNNWPLKNDVWALEIPGMSFVTSPVLDIYAGMRYYYAARADFHTCGGAVKYTYEGPDFLKINEATGVLSGNAGAVGTYPVKITATAENGEQAVQQFDLLILEK